ncbi:MAG: protein-L-isoaspartate(D-aspartate) O-methyltransferase [Anaerolineae bacterium]|jgi:protein-L-isoaspartate(D-aspartate) O-methyltransferase|nr:protein-L-isoaspartate(D-aspartate) O-methyltransferase [Anaerolineae bacterium]
MLSDRDEEGEYTKERERMVRSQIAARGIRCERVLAAMRAVPRHVFVPGHLLGSAYRDSPLPIGHGQTISQPYIVAYMTQMLELEGTDRVLEIGTGSGYQAAILSQLAAQVISVERFPSLAKEASQVLESLGCQNVRVEVGDGSLGWPAEAPYDAIIVTAAAPHIPQPLQEQLAEGGRLVAPVGPRWTQELIRIRRTGDQYHSDSLMGVAFVPLIGEHGWQDRGSVRRWE